MYKRLSGWESLNFEFVVSENEASLREYTNITIAVQWLDFKILSNFSHPFNEENTSLYKGNFASPHNHVKMKIKKKH